MENHHIPCPLLQSSMVCAVKITFFLEISSLDEVTPPMPSLLKILATHQNSTIPSLLCTSPDQLLLSAGWSPPQIDFSIESVETVLRTNAKALCMARAIFTASAYESGKLYHEIRHRDICQAIEAFRIFLSRAWAEKHPSAVVTLSVLKDERRCSQTLENLKRGTHLLERTVGPNDESTVESLMNV